MNSDICVGDLVIMDETKFPRYSLIPVREAFGDMFIVVEINEVKDACTLYSQNNQRIEKTKCHISVLRKL